MSNQTMSTAAVPLVKTGVPELDTILGGGFTPNRVYLIEGTPGSGKTTFALQFLMQGRDNGEKGLYVTFSETKDELIAAAVSHGWDLDGIEIFELGPLEIGMDLDDQYTMFQPAEVELNILTTAILAEVERASPVRIVFDSLSEMQLLSQGALRFRHQILALRQFFASRQCTVLMTDDRTLEVRDLQLQSLAHGVIQLEQLAPEYGADRRRLRVIKMRGGTYAGGFHDFIIERGGSVVFPRLVAADHPRRFQGGQLKSGVKGIDELLGGGIDRGTSVLLLGPAGVGKSTLGLQYAITAVANGDRAELFTFDESLATLLKRAAGLGMPVEEHIESGLLKVHPVDPAELSPGEFDCIVRAFVDRPDGLAGAKIVIIDSLNGYLNAMPEERFLLIQLHELLTYLGHQGVVTFLVVAQHGILVASMQAPLVTSYLADSVILFRYLEAHWGGQAGHLGPQEAKRQARADDSRISVG